MFIITVDILCISTHIAHTYTNTTVTAVYSTPLLCGCYVIQVTNCLGLCRNYEHYDDRDSVGLSENKLARRSPREAPTSRKLTQIKPVTLCAHQGNQASFEACVVDLRRLEEHTFSTALL